MEPSKIIYHGGTKVFKLIQNKEYTMIYQGITYIGCLSDFIAFLEEHPFIDNNRTKANSIWLKNPKDYSLFFQQIKDISEKDLVILKHKDIIDSTISDLWSKEKHQRIWDYLKQLHWIHEKSFDTINFQFIKNQEKKKDVISFSPEIIYEVSRFELMDI